MFAVSSRTRRLVDSGLERKFGPELLSQPVRDHTYYMASLDELGISPNSINTRFNRYVTARDPYNMGFQIYNNDVVGDSSLHFELAVLQFLSLTDPGS